MYAPSIPNVNPITVPDHSAKGSQAGKGKETITEGKGERKNLETNGARKEDSQQCGDNR